MAGALDRVQDRRELGQEPVARQFDDAAGVFGDGGIDDLGAGGPPGGDGAVGVLFHQPRIARHVRGKHSREPPSDIFLGHSLPPSRQPSLAKMTKKQ